MNPETNIVFGVCFIEKGGNCNEFILITVR